MKQSTKNWINTAISFAVMVIAVTLLYHRLRNVSMEALVGHLRALEKTKIFLVLMSTVLSYLVLTGYDWLALRFLKKKISYSRAALASFIGYSLSKNLGISWLTGGSLRYRFYSRWGLGLGEVTKLVLFNTSTFLLGFFLWGGLAFSFFPLVQSDLTSFLPRPALRAIGISLILLPLSYLLLCFSRRKVISFRGRRWTLPPPSIALLQLMFGMLDVFFTLWPLYLLLPAGALKLTSFFGIYFTGQLISILTHSPGGLGVFETVMFEMMKGGISEPALLSSLLLYRVVYFLLPLVLGIALLAIDEIRLRKGSISVTALHPQKKSR